MKDIIDKTKKMARMAGQTEQVQYLLAKRLSRINFLLSWLAIGMITAVGASFFTPYEFSDPIISAFVALGAALLILLVRVSRLNIRTSGHLFTGNLYGRIYQETDILLVKMQGGDISRSESLIQLEKLNTTLCDLIAKTAVAPNKFYRRSAKRFNKAHPELKCLTEVREPSEFLRSPAPRSGIEKTT